MQFFKKLLTKLTLVKQLQQPALPLKEDKMEEEYIPILDEDIIEISEKSSYESYELFGITTIIVESDSHYKTAFMWEKNPLVDDILTTNVIITDVKITTETLVFLYEYYLGKELNYYELEELELKYNK